VTIKHSIPTTSTFPDPKVTPDSSGQTNVPSYLLHGGGDTPSGQHLLTLCA
jgi:hypothetical protein